MKIIHLLKRKSGETMVEVIVSVTMFLLAFATLNTAVFFATNAQKKAEEIRDDFSDYQSGLATPESVASKEGRYSFYAISPDGTEAGSEILFSVDLDLLTKTVGSESGSSVDIRVFSTDRQIANGGDSK